MIYDPQRRFTTPFEVPATNEIKRAPLLGAPENLTISFMNALAGCHTIQDVINTLRLSPELSGTHKITFIVPET